MKKDILPQGDRIRQFLTNGNVSSANITSMLREKGVFLGNAEKNSSVPLLMKSLLSPNDINEFWETQKIKEEVVKYRTATIKCSNDLDLKDVFSEDINLRQKITDSYEYQPNFSLIGTPHFYFENDEAIFNYKIQRQNLLENWNDSESEHTGAVHITKSKEGDIELSIKQDSTSKETIIINNIISSEIKRILKDNNVIQPNDDFIRIKFDNFTNSNRIQFLYAFTADFCIFLDFISITDIDLHLDENVKSHADIKKFLDEIDSLKLSGKGLQRHILLANLQYHPKLIFAAISLKYNFNINGIKGTCIIDISFPDYIAKKDDKAELQISYSFTVTRDQRKQISDAELRRYIYKIVEKEKVNSYEKHKNP